MSTLTNTKRELPIFANISKLQMCDPVYLMFVYLVIFLHLPMYSKILHKFPIKMLLTIKIKKNK